ncbi:molybdate ABC transporter substrate-binding protein [Actinoplanes sp. GCM10030250]|uniref:molybdate ABC transporter substrate-binding protein n=1 Tax=Actinoplanes sp. GCM10030250 TaxID=3273376 RepID=UPI00360BE2DF
MRRALLAAAAALTLAGCGAPATSNDGTGGTGTGASQEGPGSTGVQQIRVLADESLRKAFDQVETSFEQRNPQAEVVLTYGEGIDLARQITDGQPAEVFVTEDPSAMATVTGFGKAAGEAETFAGGLLRIVAVSDAGASFVTFVREGDGLRVLTDTGVLRP